MPMTHWMGEQKHERVRMRTYVRGWGVAAAALVFMSLGGVVPMLAMAETDPPIATLNSITEVGSPEYQLVSGSTVYVNPAQSGSFTVSINASDAGSGMDGVEFKDLDGVAALWSPDGTFVTGGTPYDYSYSWSAGASSPGATTADAYDLDSNFTAVPFSVIADATGSTGSNITAPGGATNASPSVSFTVGTDAETGVVTWQLQRRDATLTSGVCGAYDPWVMVGAPDLPSPFGDATVSDATCVQYQLVVTNGVGIDEVIDGGQTLMIDQTDPSGASINHTLVAISTSSTPITIDTGTDGESGIGTWQLQRASSSYATQSCDVYGPYADTGSVDPVTPYSSTGLLTDSCYTYRLLVSDAAGNQVSVDGPGELPVDLGAPAAAISTLGPLSGTMPVAGTSSDGISSIARVDVTYSGNTGGTVCANPVSPTNWSCSWNTSALVDGTYTVSLAARDVAGNVTTVTRDIVVDNTGPTASLTSLAENVNPQYQYVTGSTVWVNANQSGSFDVNVSATDTGTGMGTVTFPDLDGAEVVWTPGSAIDAAAPYAQTYSWTSGATQPSAVNAVARDIAGATTNVGFTVRTDILPPTVASLAYTGGATSSSSRALTLSAGSDTGSGIGSWQVQRRDATFIAGSCGAYGAFADVGAASPASPMTDTGLTTGCHQYRLVSTDRVGNAATVTPATTVQTDVVAPAGTISAAPAGPVSGTPTITGTSADAASGISSVTVRYSGPASGTVCASPATPASWSCPWNTTALAAGTYTLTLAATDLAGNVADVATRTIDVDNDGPAVTLAGFTETVNPANMLARSSTMFINPSVSGGAFTTAVTVTDDNAIDHVTFPGLGAGWTPVGTTTQTIGGSPFSLSYAFAAGAADPPAATVTAEDELGNIGTASFNVTVDQTAPSRSMSAPTADVQLTGSVGIAWTGSDTAGVGGVTFDLSRRHAGASGSFGAWADVAGRTNTTSTTATHSAPLAGTWCYRVVATDALANDSAPSAERCTAVPLDDDALTAGRGWKRVADSGAYGGDLRQSSVKGARLTAPITATSISLIATRCRGCGTVDVLLGTRLLRTINLAATSTKKRQVIPVSTFTSLRSGTLKLRVRSTGKPVKIEGVAIER